MEPTFEKVPLGPSESLHWNDYERTRFEGPWHYHPEYELTLVVRGRGARFIGDRGAPFQEGDLVLVGPNLPHSWVSEPRIGKRSVRAVVVQFGEALVGRGLLQLPEMRPVGRLLARSARGLTFEGKAAEVAARAMISLSEVQGARRLIALLTILQTLAESRRALELSNPGFRPAQDREASDRMDRVHRYLLDHFQDPIRLDDVAKVAHLSRSAFCRFFLLGAGKPLTVVVNELRVGHACRLLLEGKHNASESCFASGFHNLSNFNRQFLRVTGLTPRSYQAKFARSKNG